MSDPLRRVLVVRYGRIGDMLVATPALRAIRCAHPDARIEVLTSRDGVTVLSGNPHVDAVHKFEWRRLPPAVNPPRASLLRQLSAASFDTVFLFETGDHHRALVRDLHAPRVFTFARGGEEPDACHAARHGPHELFNFFSVLALAGIAPDGEAYDFTVGDDARRAADVLLAGARIQPDILVAGLHAGHFRKRRLRRGPHPKTWPADRWIDVTRGLLDSGYEAVLLTGTKTERSLNRRIAEAVAGPVSDLAGRTDLRTLAAIIERCHVFIASDTGPAHLAAAVRTPVVALFGPKPPDVMGPRGDERRIARLYPPASTATASERGGHHPRLWAITPADVLVAAARISPVPAPASRP